MIILILSMDSASGLNSAGENQPSLLWIEVFLQLFLRYFCYHLPSPSPSSQSGVVLRQLWLLRCKEYVKLGTFFLEGWGLHGRVQFYKLLQRCCLSLLVYWSNLSVAPRGIIPKLPCLWIRLGKNNNHYYTH